MIQIRKNCFETNSSSTHCLSIVKRDLYDDWKNHKVVLSIHYVFDSEDKHDDLGTEIKPSNLPENFISLEQASKISKEQKENGNKYCDYYDFANLRHGDNGFMCNWGNFDTYASHIRVCDISKQVEENVNMILSSFNKEGWWHDYLLESGKYEIGMKLLEEYKNTGKFTNDMYDIFPNSLFFTPEEYYEMLGHDDCHSPFIHIYPEIVAFGHYHHS